MLGILPASVVPVVMILLAVPAAAVYGMLPSVEGRRGCCWDGGEGGGGT